MKGAIEIYYFLGVSANKSVPESSNLGIVKAFNGSILDLAQNRWTFDSSLVSDRKYRHAP